MKTKRYQLAGVFLGVMLLVSGGAMPVLASGNHYTPGVEGVTAGTVPPPGFHYRQYNTYIESDTLADPNGNDLDNDFDLTVFAQAHRFIYITDKKIFGADYGMNIIATVVGTDFNIGAAGVHDSEIGLADLLVEPLTLGWHGSRWDYTLGLGVNLPTGKFDKDDPASPGKGYFSTILTTGGTYYFDDPKSWSASVLTRFLVYGEQEDTDITPGWEFYADWGIGKQFPVSEKLLVRPGVCGYGYWQMGEDSGPGTDDEKGRVYAAGAEINLFWLPSLFQGNLRVLQEFGAEDEAEGTKVVFTITKSF